MSLTGFKARNHPQQTSVRGVDAGADDRAITAEDFAIQNERFRFTVDAAASDANARLPRYWTVDDNALSLSWEGERVWCNPPYSQPRLRHFVDKAWREWRFNAVELIVMLCPANRTEQKWWQELVEPFRDESSLFRVEFLPGRMRFLRNGQTAIGPNERPPFGCCLLIWGDPR